MCPLNLDCAFYFVKRGGDRGGGAVRLGMPAGRPRQFDEEQVLDTAIRLFRRDGFDGVGVAAVSREAGIPLQSLYNTFGDKAALYRRAVEHYGQRANDPIISALLDEADPLEALTGFVRGFGRHIGAGAEGGCLFTQVLAASDAERGRGDCDIARAYTERLRRALRKRATEAGAAGRLPACAGTPAELADTLLTLAFGVAVIGRGGLPRPAIRNVVARGLTLLGAGA